MNCKVCGASRDTRMGACFDCVEFESLIAEKLDMYDRPIVKKIEGSEALNILKAIIDYYRDGKPREKFSQTFAR